jgi:hypothetical protein
MLTEIIPLEAGDSVAHISSVGLIVPSTEDNEAISQDDYERRLDSAMLLMSRLFGGATVYSCLGLPGRGVWIDDEGHAVQERVWLVVAYTDIVLGSDSYNQLVQAARSYRQLWRQSAMAIIVNGHYTEV